ncbi:MAG: cytochrome c [Flavobacteriaceae bacterium]|nr:cytochrome c [Bacteroidota bacterium]MDG1378636.1 cytochrome c [Flavobacteriaceae bacterium]MDG2349712.1 cytochrome c [Flavobacteriaceae bacterium]
MHYKTKNNITLIVILLVVFGIYNYCIYNSKDSESPIKLNSSALRGQQLWQNNNCWACHQIYGLGGYLGPDLTNIYSHKKKGANYIKAFLNSGINSMPKFNFSEKEKEDIVEYLKYIDSTGYYPNFDTDIKFNGWIDIKYKNKRQNEI